MSQSTRVEGLPAHTTWGYGVGNAAFAFLGLVVSVNLQFFYTDVVGLGAILVAWALLIARLFDAFTDPIIGWASDQTNTRIGRRRPWIFGAAIPIAIAFYFLFSPPILENPADSQAYLLGYMATFYILLYLFWTIGAVPYFSLGAELTDDYHERVKLIAVREVCALTGLLLATAVPAFLIYEFGGSKGYSIMGTVLGCGAALILIFSGSVVKERPEFSGREKMRPFESWIRTFHNKHFRRLLLAFFFNGIGAAVPAVLMIYVSVYIIGTPTWWSEMMPGWWPTWAFYLQLYMFAGICSIPVWNYLAKIWGKRNTWGAGIALATAVTIAVWWAQEGGFGYFAILLILSGFSFGNTMTLPPSMVADVVDYDESLTGRRREGSYFAIWTFVHKLGGAVCGFAALQVLGYMGYEPGVPQTDQVRFWLMFLFSWFPAFFYMLAAIVLFRYDFSASDLKETQVQLGRA